VFGSSYGGYTASLLTAERNIRYLALWDPALYLDNNFDVPTKKLIDQDPDVFKKSGLSIENNKALKAVSNFKGDILLIRSGQTDIVPAETFGNYEQVAPSAKTLVKVVEGSNHNITEKLWDEEVRDIIYSWFKEKIS
jgi:uncharacterized protein